MAEAKLCKVCEKPIVGRGNAAKYCATCAEHIRKGYYRTTTKEADRLRRQRNINRRKELEARDTVIFPIKEKRLNSLQTGNDYIYLICPVCNCVLNKTDRFCRFCGQRIKEDTNGTQEM